MRIYGLDFTSSPKKNKPLTLVKCTLIDSLLTIENFHEFGSDFQSPFEDYADWLNSRGEKWNEREWIAGIDFPFGMPQLAITYLGWADDLSKCSWEDYVKKIYIAHPTFSKFCKEVTDWTYPNELSETGNPIKVQAKRITDQVSRSQSPMKVKNNPYPGAMFYKGCKELFKADISIPPVRNSRNNKKIAVEAYPKLVALHFFPDKEQFHELLQKKNIRKEDRNNLSPDELETKKNITNEIKELSVRARRMLRYKEAGEDELARNNRQMIIDGLNKSDNPYGVCVVFSDETHKKRCIADTKADLLDSVLCAVQASWAYKKRESGYGVPYFDTDDPVKRQIELEGWITDPALHEIFQR
ncbi:hypothetical protein V6x_56780 [Gimesia chilikensis]|uniref:DUF429 domain-containing protein n=1 Tax=Gimesia chilikensis TaxID=2605989 RepID=A0A517WL09_9PLAN|nr:hypothetical protein V6x_56780 [Gimesia chilikensis]